MQKKLNIKVLLLSIAVGLILNVVFAYITGLKYATALFPVLEILAAFIITGMVIGFFSKGITILEPGIGAFFVSIISYFIIPFLGIDSLNNLWLSDWLIIYLNGSILTFIGAWFGELLENGTIDWEKESINLNWDWIIAGTIAGVTVSIFVVNLLRIVIGFDLSLFTIPYFAALLLSGLIIGWKSPGVTIKEAGIAGFVIIVIVIDIVRMTLLMESEIGIGYILIGGLLGIFVSIIGAWIGEKIQASREVKE